MSAWRLFILSFLSNKYLYMFIPKHGFLEEAFLHCLGRSFNQRDVGHTLICYSWEKADIRATIQVQRFQLRHEAFCLTRFSDWGGVEETRPEDSFVGPVTVLPLPRGSRLEKKAEVSEMGARPTCCGQPWIIPDEGAEQCHASGHFGVPKPGDFGLCVGRSIDSVCIPTQTPLPRNSHWRVFA